MGYIHGQNIEGCFRLGSFVQLGHDQIQAISALQVTVPSFNRITSTGILVYLPGLLCASIPLLGPAQSRTSQTDIMFCAISAVFSVLVDLIGKDCFRVASKLAEVLFRYSLEITPLVEVTPARLFQICIALYDGQMKLLAEFRWIWAFSPVNGADKGLLQAHNAIFANVSAVIIHLFLLSVYAWNHLKPVLKIPRKFCIWNQTHQL